MTTSSTAGGAVCAVHPDRPASATCERCGNFTCDECSLARASRHCPACRALSGGAGFPFSRQSWTFDRLFAYCWAAFKREWALLSVAVLIVALSSSAFNAASSGLLSSNAAVAIAVWALMQIAGALLQAVLQMGMVRMCFDVLQGGRADLTRLTSQLPKLGRYVLQLLMIFLVGLVPIVAYTGLLLVIAFSIVGVFSFDAEHAATIILVVTVGLVVGAIPIAYLVVPLYFAPLELVFNDKVTAVGAIKNAYEIARGFRLSLFGISCLGALFAVVGLLACCVGIIPAMALAQLMVAGLYLTLRNDPNLPLS